MCVAGAGIERAISLREVQVYIKREEDLSWESGLFLGQELGQNKSQGYVLSDQLGNGSPFLKFLSFLPLGNLP